MELPPTPLNYALAETMGGRIAAELAAVSGRYQFWRAVGIGLVMLGAGGALGIGFYGYSFITRTGSQMDIFSKALQKHLSSVELHGAAEGRVEIQAPALTFAKGATISLDPSARLLIDPGAKVVADGELRLQAPSISIPRGPTPKSPGQTRAISNFTVFKSVPFEQGNVLTGWTFLTSAQDSPTQQYCYYNERSENSDVAVQVNLAIDSVPESDKAAPKTFNFHAALARCVWFSKVSQ